MRTMLGCLSWARMRDSARKSPTSLSEARPTSAVWWYSGVGEYNELAYAYRGQHCVPTLLPEAAPNANTDLTATAAPLHLASLTVP